MWTLLRAALLQGLVLVGVSRSECLRPRWDATKEDLRQRLAGGLVEYVAAILAVYLSAQGCLCRP